MMSICQIKNKICFGLFPESRNYCHLQSKCGIMDTHGHLWKCEPHCKYSLLIQYYFVIVEIKLVKNVNIYMNCYKTSDNYTRTFKRQLKNQKIVTITCSLQLVICNNYKWMWIEKDYVKFWKITNKGNNFNIAMYKKI